MTFRFLAGTTALALCLAHPALADTTPAQVWQDWQDLGAGYGQTLTAGNVTDSGDTLTVTGLVTSYEQNGVKASGTIDQITFTAQGDGSVAITLSDSYPFTMTMPPETAGGDPTTLSLQIDQPGLTIIAATEGNETSYSFTGPTVSATLTGIEGIKTDAVNLTAKATFTNISGKYIFLPDGDKRTVNSSFAADSATFDFAGSDPDPTPSLDGSASGPSNGSFAITMADISGTTNGTLLDAAAMVDMAAALKAGFATDGSVSAGKTTYDIDVTDATGNTKMTGSAETAGIGFAMDDKRLSYSVNGTGATTTLSSPDIPFPALTFGYGEAAFSFLMPVAPSETPADFALLTKLVDFTVSDDVWDMLDPGKQLPRDPATVIIDTKGTATLKGDLFDTAAMEAAGTTPAEVNSLEVTALQVKVAGADLTGSGAVTFDNSDTTTFEGFPTPTGKVDLKLTGSNALMDKLVAMGLVPEDQLMGFRMMLSMFANATGDDELTSTLEFKDKGFFANGQRLQ